MKKVRIAQVGITHEHAQGKINTLRSMKDHFEIVGVYDDSEIVKTPNFFDGNKNPYEGLKWMSLEEILEDETLDAVAVEVPNNELVDFAMRCAQRGLAMHMDKPGGEDLKYYQSLLDLCKSKNLPFQMGFMFRSNEAFQFALRAIKEGWLGDILEIEADMNHRYGGEKYQTYISQFKGGIMYNLGCHLIDFVAAALGRPEKVTSFLRPAPGYSNEFRNHAMAVLEYPHTFVTLRACSKNPFCTDERTMRITGTKGVLTVDPLEVFTYQTIPHKVTLRLNESCGIFPAGEHTLTLNPMADRYRGQLLELYQMIREGKKSSYTFEHDLLVHEITLAASGYTTWSK